MYLAFQEKLFRFCAVKEVKKEGFCFSRESIEVWKTLKCEGLPEIVDILEDEKTVWIVTEYIEGENLSEYMRKRKTMSGQQAASWCLQIEHVLNLLHSQNPPVFYGDLKPDNLIIQKNRIVMVDMGSLVRKGSRGKRTGTREFYQENSFSIETEDDYSLGKLMEILALYCQNRQLKKLADEIMRQKDVSPKKKRKKIRWRLKWIRNQKWIQGGLFALAIGILTGAGVLGLKQLRQSWKSDMYERELSSVRMLDGKKKQKALEELILLYPEQSEGYLELLYAFQEDAILDKEEEQAYRKMWKKIPKEGEGNLEEILRKRPQEFQKVAYETGITYWYYYQGMQGKQYAATWFQKIIQMPEEVCIRQELYEKSLLYWSLGENREKWKKYDETGENHGLFTTYWEEQKQLLERSKGQMMMTRLMLWRETLAVWKHYMVELREAGVERQQEEVLLDEMEEELTHVPEEHRRMQEIKQQLQKDEQEVRQMIQRVYQM